MPRPSSIALLSAAFCCAACAQAQTFHRAIGFPTLEGAYCVEPCSAATGGGYITAGRISPASTAARDMYVVRYSSDGNDTWSRILRSPNNLDEVATSVRQTLDGGFIIAGETNAVSPNMGISLVRLNAAGGFMWSRAFAGTPFQDFPSGTKVRELSDGTFTVIGRQRTGNIMQGRMIHVGAGGGPLWAHTYTLIGAPAELSFTDVRYVPAVGNTGPGYFVSGWFREETAAHRSAIILRTDAGGNPMASWSYSIPGRSLTADGLTVVGSNIVFSGRISTSPLAPATTSIIASVTQAAGIVNWGRSEADFRTGFAALATDIGSVVVAGSVPSNGDIGLVKLNGAGGLVFANSHAARGEGHDVATAIGLGAGYLVTGVESRVPVNGLQDVALIRTDFGGDPGCLMTPKAGPLALTVIRTVRQVNRVSNLQNITLPIVITSPNSGNIIKCLDVNGAAAPEPCPADWNQDNAVNSADFFEYLRAFFAGDADFNADEVTNSQDLFDFLAAFFAAC